MTAIIIISAIILIFAIFLNIKIKAEISYISGKFLFKVKYLCFTIFPFKEKKEKKKKNKNKKSKKAQELPQEAVNDEMADEIQNDAETSNETVQTASEQPEYNKKNKKDKKEPLSDKIDKLCDIIEKVKIIWNVSNKHLLNIFKHIYIEELMVDFLIADEDAYKAAMNYGKINVAVYNLINFIRTFFTVTIKTVDIICDFDSKESIYDFSAKITVKPSTILSAAFGILFGLLINIKKLIGKNKSEQASSKKLFQCKGV